MKIKPFLQENNYCDEQYSFFETMLVDVKGQIVKTVHIIDEIESCNT